MPALSLGCCVVPWALWLDGLCLALRFLRSALKPLFWELFTGCSTRAKSLQPPGRQPGCPSGLSVPLPEAGGQILPVPNLPAAEINRNTCCEGRNLKCRRFGVGV